MAARELPNGPLVVTGPGTRAGRGYLSCEVYTSAKSVKDLPSKFTFVSSEPGTERSAFWKCCHLSFPCEIGFQVMQHFSAPFLRLGVFRAPVLQTAASDGGVCGACRLSLRDHWAADRWESPGHTWLLSRGLPRARYSVE